MAEQSEDVRSNIDNLFKDARIKGFPKNQIVFYQGDPLTNICLLAKGYIKAYTILDSGETRTLFLLGPDDIFPIAFSLNADWDNYELKYFYQSLTDIEIKMTEKAYFKNEMQNNIPLMSAYLNFLTATNEAIINQLQMMKSKGAINKVAYLLPYLINKLGKHIKDNTYELKLKISHQEIADLTGLTRETTTQQIKKLERDGVIQQKRGTWIIKLPANLET
jgi:CRP/FNR family cyclic AMP-dependent transcriptional regulator